MKYIILVLWTFSLFLLMFSSFPFRVECRPTRAMGPGPPYLGPGSGSLQYSSPSSSALGGRASGRFGFSSSSSSPSACPVLEGPSAVSNSRHAWPTLHIPDITEKAWETPLVLEGMARSRSEVRSDGTYGVTFDLIRVVKGDAPLLRRRKQFRLQFLDNPSGSNGTGGPTPPIIPSRNTGLIPSRPHFPQVSSHHQNNHQTSNSNSSPSSNNFNRALGLRSNSNSNQQQQQQQRSSSRVGAGSIPRGVGVGSSGGLSLKSSNLHSNYVSLQQSRRSSAYHLRGNLTRPSNNLNSPPQTVQFIQPPPPIPQYIRNYHSPSAGGGVSSAPSNFTGVIRHGRVVGPYNSLSVVKGASGSGGGGKCLPPKATVKTGRKYFVFAAKVENHFVAVFSPELANKKNTKLVEGTLCKGCGKAPLVVALQKEAVLQPKERLRLKCRLKAGNPFPVLTWYKDGRLVNLTDPRFRLRARRRQSVLVIRKAKEMDTGVYKCEGRNVFGSDHAFTRVSLGQQPPPAPSPPPQKPKPAKPPSPKPAGTTPTPRWPVPSSVCPFDSYCLNGGTCSYYETIGEYVCQCAEGYKGQRCDTKDIPNSGSYLSYFCIFGTNNPDYPC